MAAGDVEAGGHTDMSYAGVSPPKAACATRSEIRISAAHPFCTGTRTNESLPPHSLRASPASRSSRPAPTTAAATLRQGVTGDHDPRTRPARCILSISSTPTADAHLTSPASATLYRRPLAPVPSEARSTSCGATEAPGIRLGAFLVGSGYSLAVGHRCTMHRATLRPLTPRHAPAPRSSANPRRGFRGFFRRTFKAIPLRPSAGLTRPIPINMARCAWLSSVAGQPGHDDRLNLMRL